MKRDVLIKPNIAALQPPTYELFFGEWLELFHPFLSIPSISYECVDLMIKAGSLETISSYKHLLNQ
jgi:hypothetical protein